MSVQTHFLTGCASGIGRHVADLLIARGDRVYATDVNFDGMSEYAKEKGWPEDRVKLDKLDVRHYEEWQTVFGRAVDAFERIDVCMNIAGIMYSGWLGEQPASEIELTIDINTKGVIWGTQVASQHMASKGGGHIVNIASLAGLSCIPGLAAYCASKHAVRGFSIAIAYELKRKNVYVTAVCPDAIDTPLLKQSSKHEAGAMVFSATRLLTLDEIGEVILNRVLVEKPLQIVVPAGRGWMARFSGMFPTTAWSVLPSLTKRGRSHQTTHTATHPS